MCLKRMSHKRKDERMPDFFFKLMTLTFKVVDIFFSLDKRISKFGIKEDFAVVDYGCGPGRYTIRFSKLVGEKGKVYAVDIHELAIESVKKKIKKHGLGNIKPILVDGYNSKIADNTADVVCAIDMIFGIKKPTEFLKELHRITKKNGALVVDDGHQPREETKRSIIESGVWNIYEETSDHLKCSPA